MVPNFGYINETSKYHSAMNAELATCQSEMRMSLFCMSADVMKQILDKFRTGHNFLFVMPRAFLLAGSRVRNDWNYV